MNVDNKNIQNNIIKYQSRSIHYNNHNTIMDLSQSKLFNINDKHSSRTADQFPIRYDGRGVPIIKGKEKKHHAIFCDELDDPKTLIHIDSIQNFKNLNINDSNVGHKFYENNNFSKGKEMCCCKLF